MSEFLREKQGEGQITEKQHGQNQGNDCGDRVGLHGLPQLLAGLDVKERQAEENYREQQHRHILHSRSLDSMSGTLGKPPAQDSFWLSPRLSIENYS
jgi:hypothetical protein